MDALMLPLNWQRVRLGDIAEIKRGVRITKNELDVFGKYPVVSGGVGFLGYTNNFNRYENTITIAQYGTAGYVNFQKNKFWANDVCFCVYPNKDVIKNIFLYYFLKVNQNYLYEISNRNATPYSISKDKILDFEILLPPLNEQIAIANILSDVDRYLYSLDALILKKESVKKALSFELLSQRKRLKGFNQAWQRVRLGDVAEIKRGASPRPIENPKWFCANSNVGWVRISDISKNSRFLYKTAQKLSKKGIEKSRLVKQNSLIMSMCATIGKPIITKIDTCIHDGFVVFENPKIDLNYLYYFLCYIEKEWLESGQQGSQVNLNVDLIKNKEVFYPKD
ncbi:restriction endonuclease subunit S, partial [Helicobacter pylori]